LGRSRRGGKALERPKRPKKGLKRPKKGLPKRGSGIKRSGVAE